MTSRDLVVISTPDPRRTGPSPEGPDLADGGWGTLWKAARIANGERPANRAYTSILREWGWVDDRGKAANP